jgi:hypothetical protein
LGSPERAIVGTLGRGRGVGVVPVTRELTAEDLKVPALEEAPETANKTQANKIKFFM